MVESTEGHERAKWARATRSIAAIGLFVFFACRSSPREPTGKLPVTLPAKVHGMNVRPVGDPRKGYGSEKAKQTLVRLSKLGVNTIGVLIEGRMSTKDSTDIRGPSPEDRERLRTVLLDAESIGLATVVVPHVYLDDGAWRGDVFFDDAPSAAKWWDAHEKFILDAADDAKAGNASVLSVGVELKAWSSKDLGAQKMRELAAKARGRFPGLLTYSANWDEAESVRFWDAVDLVGVNGYYPLLPDVVRGAEDTARRLTELSKLTAKQVLVTEVGYRSGPLSHERPWEWPEDVADDVDLLAQASAYAAVLSSWPHAPGVRGLLMWVVPTDPDDPLSEPPNGFNPLNKPAEQVLGRAFVDLGR